MRKFLSLIFFALVVKGCTTLRPDEIKGKKFTSASTHMVKPVTIKFFNDSLFLLQERGGMLYSKGTWKASSDGKFILLKSFKSNEVFKWDTAAYFVVTKPRIDIVKNKLVYKDIVLTEEHSKVKK